MIAPLLVLVCVLEGFHFFGGRSERLREVYGGAFQIAHPEYRVLVDSTVSVSPVSASTPVAAYELYPRFEGRRVDGAVSANLLGLVSAPDLPETKMSLLVRSFEGGKGVAEPAKAQAREVIAALPDDSFSAAIVELANPLTEDELIAALKVRDIRSDALYLFVSESPGLAGKPVYWRSCAVYQRECESTSPIELFRRWTDELDWTDTLNLRSLGLDLDVLRQAAQQGKIYGLLTYGYSRESLAELIEKPEVRTIKVVETASVGS
ncbi:hypothetical protein AB0I81_60865 [Nonomuraea sp. NPDC050404]|uniref:hypothetical protein n=1 Tax=Nonomuraea sp. NPDC050404 TaxID=3155783 RepID=UPI003403FC15